MGNLYKYKRTTLKRIISNLLKIIRFWISPVKPLYSHPCELKLLVLHSYRSWGIKDPSYLTWTFHNPWYDAIYIYISYVAQWKTMCTLQIPMNSLYCIDPAFVGNLDMCIWVVWLPKHMFWRLHKPKTLSL